METSKINKSKKRKTPFVFAFAFRFILVISAIALVLSYLSVYINPAKFSIPLFFGLYFIPIAAVNVLLLVIAIARRSKSAWIPVIALLPSLLYAETFFKIGGTQIAEKEGIKLKIESYNVGMFSSEDIKNSLKANNSQEGKKKTPISKRRRTNRNSIMQHIRNNGAQVVCLQEVYVKSITQIDTLLKKEFKYRYYHLFQLKKDGPFFGNLILSKFKIINSGKISFPESTNLSIYTDIQLPGKTIRIYNNHLESYNVSFAGLIKKFNRNNNPHKEEIATELIELHEKMRGTFIRRSEQVNQILATINKSNNPAIICGDFNDTPMSFTYHQLSKGRKDSFKEAGSWFAGTYIPVWPLLRIDYILFPKDSEGISHTTVKTNLSDHYPIIAEIII